MSSGRGGAPCIQNGTNMTADTKKTISTHSRHPENARLRLTYWSKRTCPEEVDGLKPCPGMLSVRIHARDGGTSSRKPRKVSVMPDLSARGAVLHMEEPERPGTKWMRQTHTHARR